MKSLEGQLKIAPESCLCMFENYIQIISILQMADSVSSGFSSGVSRIGDGMTSFRQLVAKHPANGHTLLL